MNEDSSVTRGSGSLRQTPLEEFLGRLGLGAALFDVDRRMQSEPSRSNVVPTFDRPKPLLSIMVPVQLDEVALFEDLLICLDAQTSGDFELLVLTDGRVAVAETVASFDEIVAPRTRVIPGAGDIETRCNDALTQANGRYLAVVRPSVVLFARWVEVFAELAEKVPGAVLRSAAAEQPSRRVEWSDGTLGHEATSGPRPRWAHRFVAVEQLIGEPSPAGSYVLPMNVFHDFGLRFSHDIDRDPFLQAALLCGVEDSTAEVTLIHRSFLPSASDDHRGLDLDLADLDNEPVLLPRGTVRALRELLASSAAERVSDAGSVEGSERQVDTVFDQHEQAERLSREDALLRNLDDLHMQLDDLRSSTSWRITAPLRTLSEVLGRLVRRK